MSCASCTWASVGRTLSADVSPGSGRRRRCIPHRAEDEEQVDLRRADEPRGRDSTQSQDTLGIRLAYLIAVHTSVRVAVIFVRGRRRGDARKMIVRPSVDLALEGIDLREVTYVF